MVHVTLQTGAQPLSTLELHEPTVSVEGKRFLLTGFQSGEVTALLFRALLSVRPRNSLVSQRYTCQNHAQKVPIFLICLSASHTNRSSSSLEGALVGFRVAILSQQVSHSGSGVHCSQPPHSSSGNYCHATLSQCGTLPLIICMV